MTGTLTRRALAGTTASALGLGLLPLMAAPAHAASGCQLDCVGNVAQAIGPETATLTFTTTTTARVRVTFLREVVGEPTTVIQAPATTGTLHSASASGLGQGGIWSYRIVATDALGATWQERFSFKTPSRQLSIDWGSITIIDDSDLAGAGEIGAAGMLQDAGTSPIDVCKRTSLLNPIPSNDPFSYDYLSIGSGTTRSIGEYGNISCAGVPASGMEVGITVADDDRDFGDNCQPAPSWWPNWYMQPVTSTFAGSSECLDWNSGKAALPFPLTGTQTGPASQAFTITSKAGAVPSFTATGTATFEVFVDNYSPPARQSGPVTLDLSLDGQPAPVTGTPRVTATWAAPSVPGVTLASTRVSLRKAGAGSWAQTVTKSLAENTHAFTGLEPGVSYEVGLWGRDAAGFDYAMTTANAVALAAPAAPVNLAATAGVGQVTLAWQPGAENGSPITDYRVRYRTSADVDDIASTWATGTSRTITGLSNGAEYTFWVRARNAAGVGQEVSVMATPVATPPTPPAPPAPPAPAPDPAPAPAPDLAPAPAPGAETQKVAPTVVLSTGSKRRDGRARAIITGYSPGVASVVVTWCDIRISGKACAPGKARKRGASGPLKSDGTLELKLTTTRASRFNGVKTAASFGRIRALKADWIRFQVRTTWADGRTEVAAVQKVRL